jgi:hypothetical protein
MGDLFIRASVKGDIPVAATVLAVYPFNPSKPTARWAFDDGLRYIGWSIASPQCPDLCPRYGAFRTVLNRIAYRYLVGEGQFPSSSEPIFDFP